ncbi:MAG: hypothetical protein AAF628_24735 [Planctomycetota bacterium]
MSRKSLPVTAVTALLAATPLSAQFVINPAPTTGQLKFAMPLAGPYSTTRVASLTGNHDPDVVVRAHDRVVILKDAAVFQAPIIVPEEVNDLAIWRSAQAPGWDDLVVSTASGLFAYTYTGPSSPGSSMSNPGPLFTRRDVWTAPEWHGVGRLRTGPLTGSVGTGFAGVGIDRRSILSLLGRASGLGFLAGPTVVTQGKIDDFLLYDRDGDGVLEFAVRTDAGLEIFSQSGQPLAFYRSQQPGGAICRLPDPRGTGTDELVWITAGAQTGAAQVLVRENAGGLLAAPVNLGALDVVAACAADYDEDGDFDLALSIQSAHLLVVLKNDSSQGAGDPFATSTAYGHLTDPSPTSAQSNFSEPVCADMDNDGDLDFVQAVHQSSMLFFAFGREEDQAALKIEPQVCYTPSNSTLRLTAPRRATVPAGVTHIQCLGYENAGGATKALPIPYFASLRPITPGSPMGFDVPLFQGTSEALDPVYFFTFRMVEAAQGTIVDTLPARTTVIVPGLLPPAQSWVESLPQFPAVLSEYGTDCSDPVLKQSWLQQKAGNGGYGDCTPFPDDCPPWG